ncbi:MAG: c-type cytochrome [Burkholderiaceae bacterium]
MNRSDTHHPRKKCIASAERPAQFFTRLLLLSLFAITVAVASKGSYAQVAAQATIKDTIAQRAVACVACHTLEGQNTGETYYPRIAGKPSGYLYNQLIHFREGRRTWPLMTYMVDHLSDDYLREMAEYFSQLHPPYPAPQPPNVSAATLERGRTLALNGDPGKNIPACVACHGNNLMGLTPNIPGLIGLPRDYLNAQFGNWKNGTRRAAAPDCMAQIAARISVEEISAVSAWLAAQPVPANAAPASGASVKLPLSCGTVAK